MKRKHWALAAVIVAVMVAALASWLFRSQSISQRLGWRSRGPAKEATRSTAAAAASASDRLEKVRSKLLASNNPQASRQLLRELRELLDKLPPGVASRVVQSYLASGKDAATKLDITIQAGGGLGDASSLRVFLMDYLGRIDRPAAGKLAMDILSQYTTPDEWAVSLRNFAWANPDPQAYGYLDQKTRELLANSEWQKKPSVGYLEAFDTIVYAHATDLAPDLAALLRYKDNRATEHAAYLALDRLTITNLAAMLNQLVNKPELMVGREQTRADFVARADIRQPDQRMLVEQYLLDPQRTPEELNTFAAIYPNANYMISTNLLTKVKTPKAGEIMAHDREVLKIVEQWQTEQRFEQIDSVLAKMHERLQAFVEQSQQGNR